MFCVLNNFAILIDKDPLLRPRPTTLLKQDIISTSLRSKSIACVFLWILLDSYSLKHQVRAVSSNSKN